MPRKFLTSIDMANNVISNLAAPGFDHQAAPKSYVDQVARGLDWKASVRACPVGNVSLATPGASFDGVSMTAGDRVLLKDQSAGAQNGLWTWNGAASAMTRTPDSDDSSEVTAGLAVSVTQGTVNGDKAYNLTTDDPIVVGTTALSFSQLGGSTPVSYTAGAGLTVTGYDFAVGAGTGISVAADTVAIDTAIVVQKYAASCSNLATQVITHNLGTRDVTVSVKTTATPWEEVEVGVEATTPTSITIYFAAAPTTGEFRVTVHG